MREEIWLLVILLDSFMWLEVGWDHSTMHRWWVWIYFDVFRSGNLIILQKNITVPLFQCVLPLIIVKYQKSDEYIRNKIELFLHAVPWLIAFGWYIFSLVMGIVNPNGSGSCTSIPYNPPHCYGMENGSIMEGVFPDIPCGRGSASRFIEASYLILIVIPPIVMMTCLAMIYRCVRITEQKMSNYGARSILKNETSTASLGILGLLKQCHLLPCSSCKKGNPVIGSRARQKRTKKNQIVAW